MARSDVAIKHIFSAFPSHWAELVGVQRGVPVEAIDTDVSTIATVTDKVLLVKSDPPFILHLEPQGYYDEALDERMHTYNTLLRRRHQLFVHTTVLLLDRKAWGPANVGRLQGQSPLGECHLDFRYQVIKVWELPVEQLLAGGVGILPLAPIANVPEGKLPGVVDRLAQRLDQELPPAEAAELWTATYILFGIKYDQVLARALLQGVKNAMKGSSTYEEIVQEGIDKGIEKGIERGKRHGLLLLGTRKFGPPEARVRSAIDAISDPARLDALLLRLLEAADWNDLLNGSSA